MYEDVQIFYFLINIFDFISFFFILVILVGVKYHFIILICIAVMTNNAKHIFMSILAVWITCLEICPFRSFSYSLMDFQGGSMVSACNAGDTGSIPGSGSYPGEGNSNPLQYSCLENPMDLGAWWATIHRFAEESEATWRLNNNNLFFNGVNCLFIIEL